VPPSDPAPPAPRVAAGTGAVFLALICWSVPGVLVRGMAMPALPMVTYRLLIGVVLGVAVLYAGRGRLTGRVLRASTVAGLCLGVDLVAFFISLKLTTVANATVIGSLQPLLLLFAAPLLFGERIRWPDALAAIAAMGGVALVFLGSTGQASWNPRGDAWAVVTLLAWTGYFLACKAARRELTSRELTAGSSVVALAVVVPALAWDPSGFVLPTSVQWVGLLTMAGLGWSGHVLMNWALGHIPVWIGGTASLAAPIATTLLAVAVLGEALAGLQIVGMVVAAAALTMVMLRTQEVLAAEGEPVVLEPPADEHPLAAPPGAAPP
jgi:drug/metabolite transporter (DMT)-like permease